jgi:hypothetical protein
MADSLVFKPVASTYDVGVSTANTLVEIGNALAPVNRVVRIYNSATEGLVFLAFGDEGVVAYYSGGIPLPAGAVENFTIVPQVTHVAVRASPEADGSIVYVTEGVGV